MIALLLALTGQAAELACVFEVGQRYRIDTEVVETDDQGKPTLGSAPLRTSMVVVVAKVVDGVATLDHFQVPADDPRAKPGPDVYHTARVDRSCLGPDLSEVNAALLPVGGWWPPGKPVAAGDRWTHTWPGVSNLGVQLRDAEQTCTLTEATPEVNAMHCTASVAYRGKVHLDSKIEQTSRFDPANAFVVETALVVEKTLQIGDRPSKRVERWKVRTRALK